MGPRDSRGRSLRDFDLTHHLFKYRCSYLIYSAQFDALPREARQYIYQRLWDVLSGKDKSEPFADLTAEQPSLKALYDSLSPEQRQVFDRGDRMGGPQGHGGWHHHGPDGAGAPGKAE